MSCCIAIGFFELPGLAGGFLYTKKGGAQHRPYGMDEPRTSNRGIATGTACPRDDRGGKARDDR